MVGTYDGRCIFYSTDQLKYYTMIHVRSTRGKNSQGRKVTGIEPMPGEDKVRRTGRKAKLVSCLHRSRECIYFQTYELIGGFISQLDTILNCGVTLI